MVPIVSLIQASMCVLVALIELIVDIIVRSPQITVHLSMIIVVVCIGGPRCPYA